MIQEFKSVKEQWHRKLTSVTYLHHYHHKPNQLDEQHFNIKSTG